MRSMLLLLILITAGCTSVADEVPAGTTSGTTAGTTSDEASDATPGTAEVTLAPGETKSTGGISIRFDRVEGDSRCPADVTCAWEGDADLVFTLSATGEQAAQVHLHTTRRETRAVTYAGRGVTLVNVRPAPHSEREIAPGDYRATVAVGEAISQ